MTDNNADFTPPDVPWDLFQEWLALAEAREPNDPNAMSLATIGPDGMPSIRMVLMKGYDDRGFTFFTNRNSAKGKQLTVHPKAAICFHWKSLRRQVRAEGLVMPVSDIESDTYFASRSRGSRIGAWASLQSQILQDRAALQARVAEIEVKYLGQSVPRPPHWGGYRLVPLMIEFWQDREFRLHDRFIYRRETPLSSWQMERLYP